MNNNGNTVLHMILCSSKYKKSGAELFKPVKSVKHLLSVGAKINMADVNGLTGLNRYVKYLHNMDEERDIVRVLFAAGEKIDHPVDVSDYLHLPSQLCLKHLCREVIREHLLQMNPHKHLFNLISQIKLLSYITQYLLYYMSLN